MNKEWNNHKQQCFIQMHMYGDEEKVVLKILRVAEMNEQIMWTSKTVHGSSLYSISFINENGTS